jgi:gliding motility-associated lipoprotein GldJ
MKTRIIIALAAITGILVMPSCKKSVSGTTGQGYNNPKWGGFEKHKYKGQETGPGLVLVEGGSFTMGTAEQDVEWKYDNFERRVTVASFYMDEVEISNTDYREYLWWLLRVFPDFDVYKQALPDTLVWRSRLAFNEPYAEYYLRHPSFNNYPVVGVSWLQATDYCAWRTNRVNTYILDREGIMVYNPTAELEEENFNTASYLSGLYDIPKLGKKKKQPTDYTVKKKKTRRVKMEDGILLPEYRLPSEAEWEYAAKSLIGNSQFENVDENKVYPWNDLTVRWAKGAKEAERGKMLANFKRGKGDQGGIASELNDAGFITTPVYSYWPNDYGLYNMAGNVSEWVMDVYRPLSWNEVEDFNPFRGNVFKTVLLNEYGEVEQKDSLGRLQYRNVTLEENVKRRNYKVSDNIGYNDEETYRGDEQMYEFGTASLVNNKARVYKGGSWNDRAYWMAPGTRRFLDEELSLSTLGFRCAMIRIGAPLGNSKKRDKKLPASGIKKKGKKR